jgi:hypothetical protein
MESSEKPQKESPKSKPSSFDISVNILIDSVIVGFLLNQISNYIKIPFVVDLLSLVILVSFLLGYSIVRDTKAKGLAIVIGIIAIVLCGVIWEASQQNSSHRAIVASSVPTFTPPPGKGTVAPGKTTPTPSSTPTPPGSLNPTYTPPQPSPTPKPAPTSVPFTLTCTNYNSDYGQSSPDITLTVANISKSGSLELTFRYEIHNNTSTDITNWTMGSYLLHSDGTTTDQVSNPDNSLIAANTTFSFNVTYSNLLTSSGTTYQLNIIQVQNSGAWTYHYAPKAIVLP